MAWPCSKVESRIHVTFQSSKLEELSKTQWGQNICVKRDRRKPYGSFSRRIGVLLSHWWSYWGQSCFLWKFFHVSLAPSTRDIHMLENVATCTSSSRCTWRRWRGWCQCWPCRWTSGGCQPMHTILWPPEHQRSFSSSSKDELKAGDLSLLYPVGPNFWDILPKTGAATIVLSARWS